MHILKIIALALTAVAGTRAHYPCPSGEKCLNGCTLTCPPRSTLVVENKLCDWGYSIEAVPVCREEDRFDSQLGQCTGLFMNYTLIKAPCITRNGHQHEIVVRNGKDYCMYKYPPIKYSCPDKYFYMNSLCKMMTPATCVLPSTEEAEPGTAVASPPRPSHPLYPSMSQQPKPRPLTTSQTQAPRNLYEKGAAAIAPSPSTYPTRPPSPPAERSPVMTSGRFFLLTVMAIVVIITLKVREMRREIVLKRGVLTRQGLYSPRGVAESAFKSADRESRTRSHLGGV